MAEEKKAQSTEVEESSVDALLGRLEDQQQKSALKEFIERIGKDAKIERLNAALIDSYIAEIDEVMSAQMDEILHNEEFQAVESTWRGLEFLIQSTKFDKPVKFEVFDVTKEEIYDDLDEAASGEGYEKDSALWEKIYWDAYDLVGGHPYTAIVSDFRFNNTPTDIGMLRHVSALSERAQLPFLGSISPQFFDHESFEGVMSDRFLDQRIAEDAKYTLWRSFREDDRSKYVGLTLPGFLGRLNYAQDSDPTKNFNYTENVYRDDKDHSLWVNSSFALASNMVQSFEKSGWSVKIVGVDSGGRVANLPTPTYEEHGQTKLKVPVEASVGMAKDQELCKMGFVPLAHWDRTDYACFFEVPSVKRPQEFKKDPQATANSQVTARLQYTMLVTRIAHFLRYRQLRFVGRNASAGDIEQSLRGWLDTIVSDMPNPSDRVVAERPLRSYSLTVRELEDRPGVFQITCEFRPHVAIVGMDINLKLVAFHSDEEGE